MNLKKHLAVICLFAIFLGNTSAGTIEKELEQNLKNINTTSSVIHEMMHYNYLSDPKYRVLRYAWNKINENTSPRNEKELLAQYLAFLKTIFGSHLDDDLFTKPLPKFAKSHIRNFISDKKKWGHFVDCVASNPMIKKQFGLYYARIFHQSDRDPFYFLYPREITRDTRFEKLEELRKDFLLISKNYTNLDYYFKNERMVKYHPYVISQRVFHNRAVACLVHNFDIEKQTYKAEVFDTDPLNQLKGRTYQYDLLKTPYEEFYHMPEYLNTNDYTEFISDYSFKKGKVIDIKSLFK